MTREEDIWHCLECGNPQGRHDMWFEGDICSNCNKEKNKEMKTLQQVFDILEDNNITINNYQENDKLCGYELNTYTPKGVNQIIFLDFREEGNPEYPNDFFEKFSQYVKDIDIDEEIEINRQNEKYRKDFTLRESLEDFEFWKIYMESIVETIKNDPPTKQTENDKLIANFLNWPTVLQENIYLVDTEPNQMEDSLILLSGLFKDWNYLMKVVEKIEKVKNFNFTVYINNECCKIGGTQIYSLLHIVETGKTKREAVYSACVEFIKWYNQQKN